MEDHTVPLLSKPRENAYEDKQEFGRLTFPLVILIATIVLSSFNFGFNIGVINTPQKAITCASGDVCSAKSSGLIPSCIPMSDIQWSVVVSSTTLGGLLGGLMGGKMADVLGRKKMLMLNDILFLLGAALSGLAVNFEMLLIGRGVIGIGSGVASSVVPMYLSEIAPTRLRGAIGTLNQLTLTIAILISQLMGIVLSSCPSWRYLLGGATGAVALIQLIVFVFSPESPRWYLIRGRNEEAKEALEKLRAEDVTKEFDSLQETGSSSTASSAKFTDLISRVYFKSLVICVGIQMAQQLSGINAVFYYSTSIFQTAGIQNADVVTAVIGIVNVLATVVATVLMDKAGRRPLLLVSQTTQFVFLTLLAISMIFAGSLHSFGSIILVGSVIFFVIGFAVGMGPIPWLIVSEMFPGGLRGYAVSVAVTVNWTSNFLVALLFPIMANALGNFTFIPFAAIVFFFFLFTWFLLPETKGKSIEELTVNRSNA